MAEAVIGVVTTVAEWLFDPIRRQICYVCKYESNIKELKKHEEKLQSRRKRVQIDVEKAWIRGDEIYEDVQTWLDKVDEFTEEAADVISKLDDVDGDEIKEHCFKRLEPHLNLKMRYLLGKKAVKLVGDRGTLFNNGDFQRVSYRIRPQRLESMYVQGYQVFDSRESIFKDIMGELMGNKVNIMGVHGMGGVGKTMLVRKVVAQATQVGSFDEVVLVEVKENPEIKTIQKEIAEQLGLVFEEETIEARASVLRTRLKKVKRVLIVLDNLWGELNLDQVGIPLGKVERVSFPQIEAQQNVSKDKNMICKILLTSRDLQVCNVMKTKKNFLVVPLSSEEAMGLFWKLLDDSTQELELESVAIKIVGKCAGLPIAIAAIAKSLKNKSKSYWDDALNRLEVSNIEDIYDGVYSVIRLSYELLKKNEARSLFLLCGLHGVGNFIPVKDLISCGMGLGLFKNINTVTEGRKRVDALIEDLKAASLLLDSEKDVVKMHDVTHVVAKAIAAENLMFNMENIANLRDELEKEKYKNSVAISLPYGNTGELPKRLGCQGLDIFLFLSENESLHIPNTLFEGLEKLKVLELKEFSLPSLPLSLDNLANLHTLCLDYCHLGDITMIGKLKTLKMLSFYGSDIESVPQQIGQLTQLKLLDLSKCSKLKVIMPNVLSSLSELEELYIDESFVQWELEGQNNASLAELKVLPHLTTLHLHVNDAETMPEDLIFENLERYNILIGDVWGSCAVSKTSRMLKVKLNNMNYLSHGVFKLLRGAEYLHLDELNGFRNVYPELSCEDFPNLRHLDMQNDHCISYIIDEEWGAYDAFPILESLLLCSMINLKKICNDPRVEHFNNLKVIKVEYCDSLKYLFSLPEAKILSQLQEIEVKNCKNFKEIVCEESEENSHITVVEFCQLQSLTLKCLQNFAGCGFTTNMSSEEINPADENMDFMTLFSKKVAFPSLKNLNLSSLNIKSMWLDQIPTISFGETLTSLVVERCNSLKYLFSFSMVERLAQLQRLQICNCELIEMIIDTEELVGRNKRIETCFPKLCHLKLEGLPKLTSFGSGNLIKFPFLDDLQIKNCSSLSTFCSSSTYVDAHPLLDEKVLLPNMASLNISSINCDNIWLKQLPVQSSCNRYLTMLVVDGCANLKYLFSSSMVKSLDQLRWLYIWNCTIMEEIIVTAEEEKTSKMLFPSLIRMDLENLPKLARFCSFTGISIELPLIDLWIKRCPSMQTFISNSTCVEVKESMELAEANSEENMSPLFDDKVGLPNLKHLVILEMDNLRRIWHNRQALHRSSNLLALSIGYCKRLVNVFPYHMVGKLGKLQRMYVYFCDSLEYIIEKHERMTQENIFCEEEVIKAFPKFVFPRLVKVQLAGLPMLKNFYPGVHILGWRVLTLLDVSGCCNKGKTYCAEYLSLQESNGKSHKEIPNDQLPLFLVDSKVAFQRLEEWTVELNDSMPQICDGIYGVQLSKLKVLRVTCSPNNAATLPTCAIPLLPNLDKLFIQVAAFKEIFLFEEQGCEGESAQTPIHLSELQLVRLPLLLHLCRENSRPSQVFQRLTTLNVLECSSLKVLVPPLVCFRNLTTLEVSNCHGLINLVTLPTARNLTQLTRMSITECERIEEIIMCVADEEKDQIVFSKLEFLELRCLPSLASFCSGNHSFKFPSLKQIIVRQCPNLKVFCWGILSTPKLRKLQLTEKEDEEGCWEGDLNTTLRHLFQGMVGFSGLEKLELSKFPRLKEIWDGQIPVCFFSNLRSLVVEKCTNITSAISVKLLPFLNNLTFLRIKDCDSIEEVFHLDKLNHDDHTGLLSQLTSLYVVELPRLMNILNISHLEIHAFVSLKILCIHKCSSLRYIVTTTIIQGLVQLREVIIRDCVMVEEIIAEDRPKDAAKDCITVPQLNSIFLELLPNLTSFCSEINVLQCPYLKTVTIKDCPKMETFLFASMEDNDLHKTPSFVKKVTERIWLNKLPTMSSFIQNLTTLIMDGCDRLECMLSSSMVESLVKLKIFQIHNCMVMEAIVVIEEENERTLLFPQLEILVLKNLPQLTRFCDFRGNLIELNSLIELRIENCPNVEKFISNSACGNTMLIKDDHMQPFFDKKVQLPSLQFLAMVHLDKLRKIWHDQFKLDICLQLRKLTIRYCQNLKVIFSSDWHAKLEKLDLFVVCNCQYLEEIFYVPKISTVTTEELTSVVPRIVFPQLTLLHLQDLPKLRSFYSGKHISEWPVLKVLEVWGCNNVEILASEFQSVQQIRDEENQNDNPVQQTLLFLDKVAFPSLEVLRVFGMPKLLHIWKRNTQTCDVFPSLTTMEVFNCSNLKILVASSVFFPNLLMLDVRFCGGLISLTTTSTATSMLQLKRLKLGYCYMLENIVSDQGNNNVNGLTVFKELKEVELNHLPSFKGFHLGNHSFTFPSLEQVIVKHCPNMNTFSRGVINTPKLQRVELTGEDQWRWESDLNTTIQLLYKEMVGFHDLESLELCKFPHLKEIWNDQIPVSFVRNLRFLTVDECPDISCAVPINFLPCLNSLTYFCVMDCETLEEVFHLEELNDAASHSELLPQLNHFRLIELPKLRNIWDINHLDILGFVNLKILYIRKCSSLRYIFTTTIILGLKQLQEVTVRDCVMVEEIITEDRLKGAAVNNIIVPLLNSILLESLPNLKSFYSGSSVLECPSLKTISITDCPEVKTFVFSSTKGVDFYNRSLFGNEVAFPILEELKLFKLPSLVQLWNESSETFRNLATLEITDCGSLKSLWPCSVSLQKLTTLEILKCDGLTNLVTFSTAKSLEQLTKITITDCKMMEEIVTCVGGEDNDVVVFRELKYLGLHCLPSITGFYLGNYTIELPSLEQVVVRQCSKMNTFSQGAVSTPKLLSVQFTESVDVSRWEGDLNTIIQKLSQESLRIS